MSQNLFFSKLEYNISIYQENEANRWKFLEEFSPKMGQDLGYFINSPKPILSLTASYILFVCLVGPFIMRNRQPLQLKNLIRFYNLVMVFLAGVLLYYLYQAVESVDSMIDCKKIFTFADQSATKIYQMSNFVLFVRVSEYLDTIFFTLRKKQNQVTFLHVFHHAFVPVYAYWTLRTAPTRFNVFIILINSFIHILMYFYYFLATFQVNANPNIAPKGDNDKKTAMAAKQKTSFLMLIVIKLLMFKKYMTQLQILQFIALATYSIWVYFQPNQCGVSMTYITSNLSIAFGFLGLFLHFYINVYKNVPSKDRPKRD